VCGTPGSPLTDTWSCSPRLGSCLERFWRSTPPCRSLLRPSRASTAASVRNAAHEAGLTPEIAGAAGDVSSTQRGRQPAGVELRWQVPAPLLTAHTTSRSPKKNRAHTLWVDAGAASAVRCPWIRHELRKAAKNRKLQPLRTWWRCFRDAKTPELFTGPERPRSQRGSMRNFAFVTGVAIMWYGRVSTIGTSASSAGFVSRVPSTIDLPSNVASSTSMP